MAWIFGLFDPDGVSYVLFRTEEDVILGEGQCAVDRWERIGFVYKGKFQEYIQVVERDQFTPRGAQNVPLEVVFPYLAQNKIRLNPPFGSDLLLPHDFTCNQAFNRLRLARGIAGVERD